MLRADVCYPYPVLRPVAVDFVNTIFSDQIHVENTATGYKLITNFTVNNDNIAQMIEKGILSYAVFVFCKTTLLRKMFYIDNDNPIINIEAKDVHYQVKYTAFMVVLQDIAAYWDEDFEEDYKENHYKLGRGSIFAIGSERQFRALYDKDIIHDAASIVSISGSDEEKYMKIILDSPQIKVLLPKEQVTKYKAFKNEKSKYPLLHSIFVVPALVEAISTMQTTEPEDDMAHRPWFITLEQEINKLSQKLDEPLDNLYEYPTRTAHILLENNSEIALKALETLI